LEDVRAGRVDVIVVYKVDRLTRSLADFAKLVELFGRHNVSWPFCARLNAMAQDPPSAQ
jgi:DNA invertase Pin-like site-specific DNA recombinase